MMIERLKAEGVIDVFQTVQAMRLQRPAMVQTAVRKENAKLLTLREKNVTYSQLWVLVEREPKKTTTTTNE